MNFWNNLICNIVVKQRDYFTCVLGDRLNIHYLYNLSYVNEFTIYCCGCSHRETRYVRAPLPCRPSKFRLLVEQWTPSGTWSGFIPKHMEHPGSLHSKPASLNILSNLEILLLFLLYVSQEQQ